MACMHLACRVNNWNKYSLLRSKCLTLYTTTNSNMSCVFLTFIFSLKL